MISPDKEHFMVAAFDDGRFRLHGSRWTSVVGVVVQLPSRLEACHTGMITLDGTDATAIVIDMVRGMTQLPTLRAILLDGSVMGGLNILDIEVIFRETGIPVMAVSRDEPDRTRFRVALGKRFPDKEEAERHMELLERNWPVVVDTEGGKLHVSMAGCTKEDVAIVMDRSLVQGRNPEPLRMAHIIASSLPWDDGDVA